MTAMLTGAVAVASYTILVAALRCVADVNKGATSFDAKRKRFQGWLCLSIATPSEMIYCHDLHSMTM